MRKIFLLIGLLIIAFVGYGQNCSQATFVTEPATFTAEDEVKVIADVSQCPNSALSEIDQAYIWIFIPDGPGPDGVGGNGDFCNGSNTELAMTDEGDGKWSFTFVPTQLFDASPSEIGDIIEFIVKPFAGACDGSGDQTENLQMTVEPLIFVPTESRVFPGKFANDDFVTLYFDQSLTANAAMAELDEIFIYTWVNRTDADGNALADVTKAAWGDVGVTEELKMTNEGDGLFSLTLKPEEFYPIEDGDVITQINFIYRNAEGTVQTSDFTAVPVVFD